MRCPTTGGPLSNFWEKIDGGPYKQHFQKCWSKSGTYSLPPVIKKNTPGAKLLVSTREDTCGFPRFSCVGGSSTLWGQHSFLGWPEVFFLNFDKIFQCHSPRFRLIFLQLHLFIFKILFFAYSHVYQDLDGSHLYL